MSNYEIDIYKDCSADDQDILRQNQGSILHYENFIF